MNIIDNVISKTLIGAVLLFAALFSACAQSGDFVLAERGRAADCTIVIPSGATAVQRYAAEELRDYVARLTDVKLALVEGSGPVIGRAVVFLDAGAANPKEDLDPKSFAHQRLREIQKVFDAAVRQMCKC